MPAQADRAAQLLTPASVTMGDRGAATANDFAERMNPDQHQRYGGLVTAVVARSLASTRTGLPAAQAGSVIAESATADGALLGMHRDVQILAAGRPGRERLLVSGQLPG